VKHTVFSIVPVQPFRLDLTAWALRRRPGEHNRLLGWRDLSKLAKRDPRLAPLVEEFRGLKPPRFPTVFETVVNGIACQQLSLVVGILLLSRLAHKYGRVLGPLDDSLHAFPGPEDLAGVRSQSLRALGFSGHKANFLLTLGSAIRDRSLDLEQLTRLDN